MRSNSARASSKIRNSERRGKTGVMEVLEGKAKGFASAVGWMRVYSLVGLENTWEVFHWGNIHREWQIYFIDHSSYFSPLKDSLCLTLLCKRSNTTRTLPAGSYHNFNYRESMCLWIWKYPWCCMLIWILLLPEHLIFKKLDPILSLLSARDYSMLMKLKIGKKSASNWQWWNQVSFFHCKYFSWPDSQKFSQEGTLLVPISF